MGKQDIRLIGDGMKALHGVVYILDYRHTGIAADFQLVLKIEYVFQKFGAQLRIFCLAGHTQTPGPVRRRDAPGMWERQDAVGIALLCRLEIGAGQGKAHGKAAWKRTADIFCVGIVVFVEQIAQPFHGGDCLRAVDIPLCPGKIRAGHIL